MQKMKFGNVIWVIIAENSAIPTSGPKPRLSSGPILSGSPAQNWPTHWKLTQPISSGPDAARPVKWLLFIDMAQIWPAYCSDFYYFMCPGSGPDTLRQIWLRLGLVPETAKCNSAVKHKYNYLKRLKRL